MRNGAAVDLTPALKAAMNGQQGWGQNDGWAQVCNAQVLSPPISMEIICVVRKCF